MTRRFILSLALLYVTSVAVLGSIIMLYNNDPPPVEHFVDNTGGSNSNSCAQATSPGFAKATIGGALGGIGCLDPGEILTIRAGTYAENSLGAVSPTIPSGTSDEVRTVIRAYPGETVTIRPTTGNSALVIHSKSYISVENIIFDCTNNSGHCVDIGRSATGNPASTDITLDTVEVFGADGDASGTIIGNRQDSELTNCNMIVRNSLMHNNGSTTQAHGLYGNCRNMLVEGGAYYSNAGHGIHFYCHGTEFGGNAWTGCTNSIVRNIEAKNNGSTGIGIYNGNNLLAYNNLVHNNGFQGIAVRFGCNNCKVYNNTLYSNGTSGGINITNSTSGSLASSTGTVLRNNILFQNDGTELVDDGIGTIVSNHLCETGCLVNATVAANIFTNISGNDFSLVANSPAINQGFNLSSVFTTDYAGNTRSIPYDIGAYEYVSATEMTSVTAPNGGEQWVKTTQQTIAWTSSNVSDVIIKVDRGNDGTFEETVDGMVSTPSDGFYDWTPGGTANASVKIQICDAVDNDPCDVSDAVFSIADAPAGTLTKTISLNTIGTFAGDFTGISDTRIREASPTLNESSNASLVIQKLNATTDANTLIRLPDLTRIPGTATVTSVTLGLYLNGVTGTNTHIIDVRKVLRNMVLSQATWNIYSTGNNWTTAGGLGDGTDRTGTALGQITGVGTVTGQYYTLTQSSGGLKDYAQNVINGTDTNNYGLHLETNAANANDGNIKGFASSEGTNGQRPYFSVTYTYVDANITVTQPSIGDSFFPNETVPVRWQTTNVSGGLNIYLSRDGGVNYLETLATNFPHVGVDFAWDVTTGTCTSCMIKVQSVNDLTTVGLSAPFRVRGTSLRLK